jgi:hypothetical protein
MTCDLLTRRAHLDMALVLLEGARSACHSYPVRCKLRHAYNHIERELIAVDIEILGVDGFVPEEEEL